MLTFEGDINKPYFGEPEAVRGVLRVRNVRVSNYIRSTSLDVTYGAQP